MPLDSVILLFLILFAPILAAGVCLRWAWVKLGKRFGALPRERAHAVEKKKILIPAAAFLAAYSFCLVWAWLIEPDLIEVTRTEIPVDRPVLGHARFRIVHLSDLHLEGEGLRERRMLEAVAGEKPDLIVLTGDYLNDKNSAGTLVKVLSALEAPYGVYGVLGNWDRKFEIRSMFREAGKPLLLDEDHKLISREGHKLLLLGLPTQPHGTLADLLEGASSDSYRIFLAHLPDAVDEILALPPGKRVDLFLCGHTHGGQVRLPLWGAVITMSKYHKTYEMGLYKVRDTHMYVSRGIGMMGGFMPRLRFLCPPEVAVIDLVHRP